MDGHIQPFVVSSLAKQTPRVIAAYALEHIQSARSAGLVRVMPTCKAAPQYQKEDCIPPHPLSRLLQKLRSIISDIATGLWGRRCLSHTLLRWPRVMVSAAAGCLAHLTAVCEERGAATVAPASNLTLCTRVLGLVARLRASHLIPATTRCIAPEEFEWGGAPRIARPAYYLGGRGGGGAEGGAHDSRLRFPHLGPTQSPRSALPPQ